MTDFIKANELLKPAGLCLKQVCYGTREQFELVELKRDFGREARVAYYQTMGWSEDQTHIVGLSCAENIANAAIKLFAEEAQKRIGAGMEFTPAAIGKVFDDLLPD